VIETEQQRRWWFATHPEYSWGRTGQKSTEHSSDEDEESDTVSPEAVDAGVDESLRYERDKFQIELLKEIRFWFGTEFASKTPAEKHALLWGDDESEGSEDEAGDESSDGWWSQQPSGHPAADLETYDKYEELLDRIERQLQEDLAKNAFIREMADAGWSREWAESRWKAFKLNERIASGTAWAMTVHGAIAAARAILVGAYRWGIALGAAGSIGQSSGPGKWVEVCRSRVGLDHQSKMSGQPIIERGGKYHINEYEVPTKTRPVRFDDFRDGQFYEYKGPQGNLLNKDKEFYHWFGGAGRLRDQAWAQVKAAQGVPVIWKVGSDQVKAFERVLRGIPGISIVP